MTIKHPVVARWQRRALISTSLIVFIIAGTLTVIFKKNPDLFNKARQKQKWMNHMRDEIHSQIADHINKEEFVHEIEIEDGGINRKLNVHYTLDTAIQTQAQKLLKSYKPDYAAVVAMDANTGKVLAMASFLKDGDNKNLSNKATYPAASVFKIVPASVALDKYNLDPDTVMHYNGGNHTLYKKNAMSDSINKWTRFMTLREAFARSINTVFARLTFDRLTPLDLKDYATRYQFNQTIDTDFPVETSVATIPEDKSFKLAEIASGYNRINKLSPVQGAMMTASIANDGQMFLPYIVDTLTDDKGKIVYQAEPQKISQTLTKGGAEKLRELMEATVREGTGRKSFRSLIHNSHMTAIEFGGKTGSLQGDEPKGKVDWFVGYAIRGDEKIAIAALTVNKEYWTVKAAYLAQTIFKAHFKEDIEVHHVHNRRHRLVSAEYKP